MAGMIYEKEGARERKGEKKMEERKEMKVKYKEIKYEKTYMVGPLAFSTLKNRNIPVSQGSGISVDSKELLVNLAMWSDCSHHS